MSASVTLTVAHVATIADARPAVREAMRSAMALHANAISREVALIATRRDENPDVWARFCVTKSILSAGAKLDRNIVLACMLRDAIERGEVINTYDDALPYQRAASYGARSVGVNINRALAAYNAMREDMPRMTWKTLNYAGLSVKTRSWCLALYNAWSRVYTLDTHMLRGIAHLAGIDGDVFGITDAAYVKLAEFMLSVHDECARQYPPIVSQWALWNEFRHAGIHASHLGILA